MIERATHVRRRRRPRTLLGAVAALSLLAAGCGDDEAAEDTPSTEAGAAAGDAVTSVAATDPVPDTTSDTSSDTTADAPVPGSTDATDSPATSEPTGSTVTSVEQDAADGLRIVSLSPTHTEMLFAMGADDQLVAVDDQSNYPPAALEQPNDLSAFEPNVEAIAGYEPDLVVMGGDFTGLGEQLTGLDIDWWDGPAAATLDDTYRQIRELGDITGESESAAALVDQMQSDIESIVASAPPIEEPVALYHELDPSLYSATSATFIGQVYSSFGLRNVADKLETDAGPFPQLNAEFLVSSNPDLIFLADTKCCGETAATVSARPGWSAIAAVPDAIFEMDDDIASRWGPRTVDYYAAVADAIEQCCGS